MIASDVRENFTVAVGGVPCATLAVAHNDAARLHAGRAGAGQPAARAALARQAEFNLTCTTPALPIGPPRVNVTITNADGTSDTLDGVFMVQGPRPDLRGLAALGAVRHKLSVLIGLACAVHRPAAYPQAWHPCCFP